MMAEPLPGFDVQNEAAVSFLRSKGVEISFRHQDITREEHIRAFTVAGVTNLDLLTEMQRIVTEHEAEGLSTAESKRKLRDRIQAAGWWGPVRVADPTGRQPDRVVDLSRRGRLDLILSTNWRTSRAAAQWAHIQRTKRLRPFLAYRSQRDEHVRPLHRQWDGTILHADDPWWLTHFPPNGWRCRCQVLQFSQRELTARSLSVTQRPQSPTTTYANPRTGEVIDVPQGIDPGFSYNPGVQTLVGPTGALSRSVAAASELPDMRPAARNLVREVLAQEDFSMLMQPGASVPVMVLTPEQQALLNTQQSVVFMSTQTFEKQVEKRRTLGAPAYRLLPELGENPDEIIMDGPQNLLVIANRGEHYMAVIKATKSLKALFLTSFRRTNGQNIESKRKTGSVVYQRQAKDDDDQ